MSEHGPVVLANGESGDGPTELLLDVRDLRVRYGTIEAVKGLTFSVAPGEIVCLIGANGAGKTTTLRTLSGLLKPASGEVWYDGTRIDHQAAHAIVRAGLAQVPEGRRVFPFMTVRENLDMGAYSRQDRSALAADLEHVYELFPILRDRSRQAAGTLSGGEQQMLAMGRALMARPRLLLMDEPSMGLAPIIVQRIFEIVRQISREGTTILLVEQNAAAALRLADRGYVLETGRIVLADTASSLLANEQVRKTYLGEE